MIEIEAEEDQEIEGEYLAKDHIIRYSYKDVPTIKRFSESKAFVRGLMGPFGSGKSSGCIIEILKKSTIQPRWQDGIVRARWAVIRNTYAQLRDTSIKTFHYWFPPKFFGKWKSSEHNYLIDKIPGYEIEVMFRALDRPDQVSNLLSMELTGAWINEAKDVPWAIVEAVMGRCKRYPPIDDNIGLGGPVWSGIIMDTNPPDDDSDWYDNFEVKRPKSMEIFKQPGGLDKDAENLSHLDPGYYSTLAEIYTEDKKKVYIDGQYGYVKEGKPVYPEYKDSLHCMAVNHDIGRVIYRGWDFGLTPACVFMQIKSVGQFIVFDEMTSADLSIDKLSDDVLLHCAQEYQGFEFIDYGDPSGNTPAQTDSRTCFQILQAKGIKIQASEQGLVIRLESVKKALSTLISDGRPMFAIHPRCTISRKGFAGKYVYRRLQTSQEKYEDKPDKAHPWSDPQDCIQYVAAKLIGPTLKGNAIRKESKPEVKRKLKYVV